MAVIKFHGEGPDDFDLDYGTPITSDVLGYLNADNVAAVLEQIKALPKDERPAVSYEDAQEVTQ